MRTIKEELVQLMDYGETVFGDKANFKSWLESKSIALGGITPQSLLKNPEGIDLVRDALVRIEHGILS